MVKSQLGYMISVRLELDLGVMHVVFTFYAVQARAAVTTILQSSVIQISRLYDIHLEQSSLH